MSVRLLNRRPCVVEIADAEPPVSLSGTAYALSHHTMIINGLPVGEPVFIVEMADGTNKIFRVEEVRYLDTYDTDNRTGA